MRSFLLGITTFEKKYDKKICLLIYTTWPKVLEHILMCVTFAKVAQPIEYNIKQV